jgi:hypothetical protein
MDYYIYSNKHDLTEGMFGEALIWLIEILYYLEKQNKIKENSKIKFNVQTLSYDNLIPTFIVPKYNWDVKDLNNPKILNIKTFKKNESIDFDFNENSFSTSNVIFNKYFRFSDFIEQNLPLIQSNTLGIHYRGTDKNIDNFQANPMTQENFFMIIDDFLHKNKEIKDIYSCSDEESFIDNIRKRYPSHNIIQYNQTRAYFRIGKDIEKANQEKMTIAAIIDMLALSKCQTVIKTSSALSAFSKIINPNLKLYTVSAMKQKWFPAGLVEPYRTNSDTVNKILKISLKNHVVS